MGHTWPYNHQPSREPADPTANETFFSACLPRCCVRQVRPYNRRWPPGREHPFMTLPAVSQSITRLIHAVQDGRDSAVGPLLELYFDRLVTLARQRLQGLPGM